MRYNTHTKRIGWHTTKWLGKTYIFDKTKAWIRRNNSSPETRWKDNWIYHLRKNKSCTLGSNECLNSRYKKHAEQGLRNMSFGQARYSARRDMSNTKNRKKGWLRKGLAPFHSTSKIPRCKPPNYNWDDGKQSKLRNLQVCLLSWSSTVTDKGVLSAANLAGIQRIRGRIKEVKKVWRVTGSRCLQLRKSEQVCSQTKLRWDCRSWSTASWGQ